MRRVIVVAILGTLSGCDDDGDAGTHLEDARSDATVDAGPLQDGRVVDLGSDGPRQDGAVVDPDVSAGVDATVDGATVDAAVDAAPSPDGAVVDPAVSDYCLCMLASCHESFHLRWGERDEEALDNCAASAGALRRAGEAVQAGAFLECRQYWCDQADMTGDEPASCPAAIGAVVCVD